LILLDTHVLVWWIAESDNLPARLRARIEADAPALVSPISFWELAVLVDRGRVEVDRPVARWAADLLRTGTAAIAELTPSAAIAAAELPAFHGDPADRFLYTTARELRVPLATKDRRLRDYARRHADVVTVW
jgi:PIN domain nuclease of toxin-antitoxin system